MRSVSELKEELKMNKNDFAVTVRGLKKYYGETRGVDDLSFSVKPGEIFGILGPNGGGNGPLRDHVFHPPQPPGDNGYEQRSGDF